MRHHHFCSTRGQTKTDRFCEVLTAGYAADGGMFMPDFEHLPELPWRSWAHLSYAEIVEEILSAFIGTQEIPRGVLHDIIAKTYTIEKFGEEVVGFKRLSDKLCLLELNRGPTWAFKDYPLVLIGELLDFVLEKNQRKLTALVFTSGDTGSAAIEAVRGKKNLKIICFFPANGRITDLQQRLMTTVVDDNVTVVGVDGTSDEMDTMSRGLFNDQQLVEDYNITSLNSVNLPRILIQTAHWFFSYFRAIEDPTLTATLTVVVPTGGAGNLASGLLARQLGLPVKIVCSQGPNDSLAKFLQTGLLKPADTIQSLAAAIDIQNSYNLERVIYLMSDGDCEFVKSTMDELSTRGQVKFSDEFMSKIRECVSAYSISDKEILDAIRQCYEVDSQLICPHTATAYATAKHIAVDRQSVILCLATASPLKFPEAIKLAGLSVPTDKRTADLLNQTEKYVKWGRRDNLKDTLKQWEWQSRELIQQINKH